MLLKVVISNFKTYVGNHEFGSFDRLGIVGFTGVNGIGKSNLFDAIGFGLCADKVVLRASSLGQLRARVKDTDANLSQVKLVFRDVENGAEICLSRTLTRSGEKTSFAMNGNNVSKNAYLAQVAALGFCLVARNFTMRHEEIIAMVTMSGAQRFQMFVDLSGTRELFNESKEIASRVASALKEAEKLKNLKADILAVAKNHRKTLSGLKEFENLNGESEMLMVEAALIRVRLAEKRIEGVEEEISALKDEYSKMKQKEITENLEQRIKSLLNQVEEAQNRRVVIRGTLMDNEALLSKLWEAFRESESKRSEIHLILRNVERKLEQEMLMVEAALIRVRLAEKRIEGVEEEISALKDEYSKMKQKEMTENLEQRIKSLLNQVEEAQNRRVVIRGTLMDNEALLSKLWEAFRESESKRSEIHLILRNVERKIEQGKQDKQRLVELIGNLETNAPVQTSANFEQESSLMMAEESVFCELLERLSIADRERVQTTKQQVMNRVSDKFPILMAKLESIKTLETKRDAENTTVKGLSEKLNNLTNLLIGDTEKCIEAAEKNIRAAEIKVAEEKELLKTSDEAMKSNALDLMSNAKQAQELRLELRRVESKSEMNSYTAEVSRAVKELRRHVSSSDVLGSFHDVLMYAGPGSLKPAMARMVLAKKGHIVIKDLRTAFQCLRFLETSHLANMMHKFRLIILDDLRVLKNQKPAMLPPKAVYLSSLLRKNVGCVISDEDFSKLRNHFVGNAVVCRTLEEADDLWCRLQQKHYVIAGDGTMIDTRGCLVVGGKTLREEMELFFEGNESFGSQEKRADLEGRLQNLEIARLALVAESVRLARVRQELLIVKQALDHEADACKQKLSNLKKMRTEQTAEVQKLTALIKDKKTGLTYISTQMIEQKQEISRIRSEICELEKRTFEPLARELGLNLKDLTTLAQFGRDQFTVAASRSAAEHVRLSKERRAQENLAAKKHELTRVD
ncbi:unnamed protein product, partial [Notodromas monacha]